MASLASTDLATLGDLIVAQILATTPRLAFQGSRAWKHYTRATPAASRSRRFRLRWPPGSEYFPGGYFTLGKVEHITALRIVVDYSGPHEHLGPVINDDYVQLRDRIAKLRIDDTTGLIDIETDGTPAESDDSPKAGEDRDAVQYEFPYKVRYLQATG